MSKSHKIFVTGVVQGVGFRPFIYKLATEMGIRGCVLNDSRGVEILAACGETMLEDFTTRIKQEAPPHAVINSLEVKAVETPGEYLFFEIRKSRETGESSAGISPDLPVCGECLEELFDPGNRRHYYPYINCTNCGPRYTIIEGIPYDRRKTVMKGFLMCPQCRKEYTDPADRRFHAQPDACHLCGPHLTMRDNKGAVIMTPTNAAKYKAFIMKTAELLKEGNILAVKGIGGYHLVCDAVNNNAVNSLRKRKYREDKPFAVMAKDRDQAEKLIHLTPQGLKQLTSRERPIYLARKKNGSGTAGAVAPGNKDLGVMLPYTPLHHLLFRHIDTPLVMTSANISDEPIAFTDEDALERLRTVCDYFITGSRDILIRCDDPVTRSYRGLDYPIRRARGSVPAPIVLETRLPVNVLAVGAEQKNAVCLVKGNHAYLSQHIGDLKNLATLEAFSRTISHLSGILDIGPEHVVHDLHPGYLSSKFVKNPTAELAYLNELPKTTVQHHHAHIASCMADNGYSGPLTGIALDGTGFGTDGTVWGGEIFIVENFRFNRRFSFKSVAMPGGEEAIKKPWRMAWAYLQETFGNRWQEAIPPSWIENMTGNTPVITEKKLRLCEFQVKNSMRSPLTSSCGRLFDAISALAGIRLQANYEGQPAIELEQMTLEQESGYAFDLEEGTPGRMLWQNPVRNIIKDLKAGLPVGKIAGKFHTGLVDILSKACHIIFKETGLRGVALSGGCFMNMILLEKLTRALEKQGFTVYTHRQVPCNDGGIALGQSLMMNVEL